MKNDFSIRWITPESALADAPGLRALMLELAAFEDWAEKLDVSEGEIASRAQASPPRLRAVLAETADGSLIGFATVFAIPYAYAQAPSLEMEMLYVAEPWRGHGVGQQLMAAVLEFARNGGYARIEWNVLAANARAQAFYKGLGAQENEGWRRWELAL
jgi:GNAT superfamily N-acetyltransferase